MNAQCVEDSDDDEGILGLREVGDIGYKEAAAAFSSDDEDGEEAEETGGVHMLAATGNLRPGPAYVWGQLGGRAEYVKIMIDSGNTVGDLVSEEFARRLGLEGDEVRDHIAVPTAATATTVLVVRRCPEMTAQLEGIEVHHPATGGEGPNTPGESGAALPGPPLVQPGFRSGLHSAGSVGAVSTAGGETDRPSTRG